MINDSNMASCISHWSIGYNNYVELLVLRYVLIVGDNIWLLILYKIILLSVFYSAWLHFEFDW